jgi:hypothetical protein
LISREPIRRIADDLRLIELGSGLEFRLAPYTMMQTFSALSGSGWLDRYIDFIKGMFIFYYSLDNQSSLANPPKLRFYFTRLFDERSGDARALALDFAMTHDKNETYKEIPCSDLKEGFLPI